MRYMFLPFRRYLDFQGRSRRAEYWLFLLLNVIVSVVFTTVFLALFLGKIIDLTRRYGYESYERYSVDGWGFDVGWNLEVPPDVLMAEIGPLGAALLAIAGAWSLLVFIPQLAVTVRRLHDTNRSGWWLLLPYGLGLVTALFAVIAVAEPSLTFVFATLAALVGMVAGLSGLVLLVFMVLEGTHGPNRFGPDPKGDVRRTFA